MLPKSIVVVEDDPVLLHDAVLILEQAGLLVSGFDNAEDALSHLYLEHTGTAALFCDLQMPGHFDGLILAEIVGRHWPQIAILLTSGRVIPMQVLPSNVKFISKPWRISQVLGFLTLAEQSKV